MGSKLKGKDPEKNIGEFVPNIGSNDLDRTNCTDKKIYLLDKGHFLDPENKEKRKSWSYLLLSL